MKLSNTLQRRIILEELRKLETHPTADELYELVRKRIPQISLGTVYRNLELLSEDGQILKLQQTGKQKRFDGRVECHYHVRCSRCGRIADIWNDEVTQINRQLGDLVDKLGMEGYMLELSDVCKKCQEVDKPGLPV